MSKLFTGMRAPSTLGTFLRSFRFGHVRQVDALASRTLALRRGRLCGRSLPARPAPVNSRSMSDRSTARQTPLPAGVVSR